MRSKRWYGVPFVLVAALPGCGSDGTGGGGSSEAFCDRARDATDELASGLEDDGLEGVYELYDDYLSTLVDDAPDEIAGELEFLEQVSDDLLSADEDEVFEMLNDDELQEDQGRAQREVATFLEDECDIASEDAGTP